MATVPKDFADNLVKHAGYYNGDSDNSLGDNPRCVQIIEYTNAWGGLCYGLVMEGDRDPERYLRESEFVNKPRVYWDHSKVAA